MKFRPLHDRVVVNAVLPSVVTVLCRALESQSAYAHPALYSPHECVLKEGRKPRAFSRAICDVLQFCSHP